MKIEEIETPWHSPPRELFHDLRAEDEEALARRERAHEEVMRRLDALIRADARGETSTPTTTATRDADATMRDEGSEEGTSRVAFHDPEREGRGFRGRRGGGGEEETVRREAKGVSVQGTGDGEVSRGRGRAIDRAGRERCNFEILLLVLFVRRRRARRGRRDRRRRRR